MTREEWRQGLVRLTIAFAGTLAAVALLALLLWSSRGGSYRGALSTSLSLGALVPMLGGVGVYLGSGPVAREGHPLTGRMRVVDGAERQERERLAAGLIAFGAVLLAAAVVTG